MTGIDMIIVGVMSFALTLTLTSLVLILLVGMKEGVLGMIEGWD